MADTQPDMGVVEAIILCRRHEARVTFGEGVTIEVHREGAWQIVSREATLVKAALVAKGLLGWRHN